MDDFKIPESCEGDCRNAIIEVVDHRAKLVKENAQLKQFAHELLHWFYPMEGDDDHRAEEFVVEAMVGYMLLREPHPMVNAERIEKSARKILRIGEGE